MQFQKLLMIFPAAGFFGGLGAYDSLLVRDSLSTSLKTPDAPSFSGMILNLVFSFLVIVVLIYVIAFFVKKLSRQGRMIKSCDKNSRILDIFPLNQKQAIYIVRLFEEIYILGVSEDSINLIEKVSDEKKEELLKKEPDITNFNGILGKFIKK
ncbi:MAG: flagellar biosynthetic protein FliO [Candidatus Cloacimonetes bacterium]|nr:flagellar biosynthetic protein FliO [Candidatus Cloacimonadota bacterium]